MTKIILSVDDSASVRQMVQLTLQGAGDAGRHGRDRSQHARDERARPDPRAAQAAGLSRRADPVSHHRIRRRDEEAGEGGRRDRVDHQTVPAGAARVGREEGSRSMTPVDATETFRQEAQELLEQLEHTLLEIGHRPGDADLIDTAFRALHTIKGSGAMFGFDRVAAFTHHVETTFDLVRKGKIAATAELIALTLAAKDQMRQLIEAPDAASDAEGHAILARLQAAVDGATGAATPAESGPTTWRVNFRLPSGAMATGSNPLLLIEELRGLGEATVTAQTAMVPALEDLDPTECHVGWEVVLTTVQPREMIEQVFLFLLDDMESVSYTHLRAHETRHDLVCR